MVAETPASSRLLVPRTADRKHGSPFRSENVMGLLFVSPSIFLFLIFVLLPAILALVLSFTNYDILTPIEFVGFRNYERLLRDTLFFTSLRNVAQYVVLFVPLMIALSLGLALLLNRDVPGVRLFRILFYIPVITSPIAAATIWTMMLHKDFGLINRGLALIGIDGPTWLFDPDYILLAIVLVTLWQGVGSNTVLYLAGLQGIPRYLYEAAILDGAGRWQLFRFVVFPSLRTTTFFVLTLSLTGAFQLFDQAYALTGTGVGNSTRTPIFHIWETGFNRLRMGYASSMAFVLFLLIFAITLINLQLNRRQAEELG
ncbi:MAG: sugar ABC transporter permease [bacterium]|nr:sugar ABC transporter permease [bacterium]